MSQDIDEEGRCNFTTRDFMKWESEGFRGTTQTPRPPQDLKCIQSREPR